MTEVLGKRTPLYRFFRIDDNIQPIGDEIIVTYHVPGKWASIKSACVIQYATLRVPCSPTKYNNIDNYLRKNTAYTPETYNIIGFLKYTEYVRNNDRYADSKFHEFADLFRTGQTDRQTKVQKDPKSVFITDVLEEDATAQEQRTIGGTIFKHITCDGTGIGTNQTSVDDKGDITVDSARPSNCMIKDKINPSWPAKGCPHNPVTAELGKLMEYSNSYELNVVGANPFTEIHGFLITAVYSPGKLGINKVPKRLEARDKITKEVFDEQVNQFMKILLDNPEWLKALASHRLFEVLQKGDAYIKKTTVVKFTDVQTPK